MLADHEEELQALFAELAEEGADNELPPIIQDKGLEPGRHKTQDRNLEVARPLPLP